MPSCLPVDYANGLSYIFLSSFPLDLSIFHISPLLTASKVHLHPPHTTYTYHVPITTNQSVDNMNTKEIVSTVILVLLAIVLVVVLVALYRDCSSLVCIHPNPT